MWSDNDIIAIFISDIHLSHRAPIARANEPDWYEAMARPIRRVAKLAKTYDCPIICAGDIFDHWNNCPELVNFAIDVLPKMYIIPGQHELPNHDLGQVSRSSFQTLTKSGKFTPLLPGEYTLTERGSILAGFPFGSELRPYEGPAGYRHRIAVCHQYVCMGGHSYPGAPEESYTGNTSKHLRGFTLGVFGDNHSPFYARSKSDPYPSILNCGCFIRRKIDEQRYKPSAWMLQANGEVLRWFVPCEEEVWIKAASPTEEVPDTMDEFVQMLEELGEGEIDFRQLVEKAMKEGFWKKAVRSIILKVLDKVK